MYGSSSYSMFNMFVYLFNKILRKTLIMSCFIKGKRDGISQWEHFIVLQKLEFILIKSVDNANTTFFANDVTKKVSSFSGLVKE